MQTEPTSKITNEQKNQALVPEKKSFGSDTYTKIGPWFWFPIPKPGFGCIIYTATAATKVCLIKPCSGIFLTTMLNSGRKNHFSFKMLLEFPNLNCSTKFSGSCSIHFRGVISVVLLCRHTAVLMEKNRSFEKYFFFWSIQKGLDVLFLLINMSC